MGTYTTTTLIRGITQFTDSASTTPTTTQINQWITEIEVARRNKNHSVLTIQKEIKETTREIIKTKCEYCGMLVEHHLARCPNCNGIQ